MALKYLDGSGSESERKAIARLRKIEPWPTRLLLEKYRISGKWKIRAACVFYALKHARDDPAAVELGLLAVTDRSKVVRYRACMLLAVSLSKSALPTLKAALAASEYEISRRDIAAVIDAIEHQNSDYFVDREHSGKMTLNVVGVTDRS